MPATPRIPVACGVDIGSTNTKVVMLDRQGAVVARSGRPTPRRGNDLSINGESIITAVEDMMVEACGDRFVVHAVCVAGVGEDGVLLDDQGSSLTPALAWFDPRRREVFDRLRPMLGAEVEFDVVTDAVRTIVGWSWAQALPGVERAHRWIALTDLPAVRWTGRMLLSDTLASRTAAWRSDNRSWSAARVEASLGNMRLLPDVVPTGAFVGYVNESGMREHGIIAPDAMVVAGGHDHVIAGWAVEQLVPGAVLDSMGTAEVVVAQTGAQTVGRRDHVDLAPRIRAEGRTLLRVEELSRNVQWASRDPEVARRIRLLLIGAEEAIPIWGDGQFIPGERGGGEPAYAADASTDPRVRASAVLGALAMRGREAVEAVRARGGGDGVLRVAGGWVRSPGWMAIKSAVNEAPATPVLEPEVTAVGAAMLAATARGWRPDPAEALGGFASAMLG